jgi:hypothetical protein
MPGPFPGMDPYLEDPARWPGVHNRLITYLSASLNRDMPPTYVANIEERLYITGAERHVVPDITVKQTARTASPTAGRGGRAVLEKVTVPEVMTVWDEEVTETFIEIQRVDGPVVTIIELLSFSNKSPNSEGRRQYIQKQREVLDSPIHLMEIDFLRRGEHSVSAPIGPLTVKFDAWDYLICLSRHTDRRRYELWPVSVRKRLPRVWVPLRVADPDVIVDLQAVFNRMYDEGAYARSVRYDEPAPIPLRPPDEEWARKLLERKGLIRRKPDGQPRNGSA